MNYHETPDNIVFIHNYKNIITIKRKANGNWSCTYSILNVVNYLNSLGHDKKYYTDRGSDMFDVGELVGYKLKQLYDECQKMYGDPIPESTVLIEE